MLKVGVFDGSKSNDEIINNKLQHVEGNNEMDGSANSLFDGQSFYW